MRAKCTIFSLLLFVLADSALPLGPGGTTTETSGKEKESSATEAPKGTESDKTEGSPKGGTKTSEVSSDTIKNKPNTNTGASEIPTGSTGEGGESKKPKTEKPKANTDATEPSADSAPSPTKSSSDTAKANESSNGSGNKKPNDETGPSKDTTGSTTGSASVQPKADTTTVAPRAKSGSVKPKEKSETGKSGGDTETEKPDENTGTEKPEENTGTEESGGDKETEKSDGDTKTGESNRKSGTKKPSGNRESENSGDDTDNDKTSDNTKTDKSDGDTENGESRGKTRTKKPSKNKDSGNSEDDTDNDKTSDNTETDKSDGDTKNGESGGKTRTKKPSKNRESGNSQDDTDNEKTSDNTETKKIAVDCSDILREDKKMNGVYKIQPDGIDRPFDVFCDLKTDGDGWTVILKRGHYPGFKEDYFIKTWSEYKKGFGHPNNEYWIGNDNLYALTKQNSYILRVDLEDTDGNKAYAEYSEFMVGDEGNDYQMSLGGYRGDAGDALSYHNKMKFSTIDRDHDMRKSGSCAELYHGGWWYNDCLHANLNGLNLQGENDMPNEGITWYEWRGGTNSLAFVQMKVRPRDL